MLHRERLDGGQQLGLSPGTLNLIYAHVRDARLPKSERYGGLRRNVYHSATNERSPANDRDHRATAIVEVDDADLATLSAGCDAPQTVRGDASIGSTRPAPVLPPKPNRLTRKASRTKRQHFASVRPFNVGFRPSPRAWSMSRRPASCNTDNAPRRSADGLLDQSGVPAAPNGRPCRGYRVRRRASLRCAAPYRADDPDQQTRADEPSNQVADPSA